MDDNHGRWKLMKKLMAKLFKRSNGITLMTVASAISVLLLLGMVAGGLGIFQLNFASQVKESASVQYIAEAGIAEAMHNLNDDHTWGNTEGTKTIVKEFSSSGSKGKYTITFKNGASNYSVNNLNGTTTVPGYRGTQVPPHSALIMSTGTSGGKTRTIEVLVNLPPFKYAVATSGAINSPDSHLYVAGAKTMDDAVQHKYNSNAHVFSNNKEKRAIVVGKGTKIEGSIGAAGGIDINPTDEINGGSTHTKPLFPCLN